MNTLVLREGCEHCEKLSAETLSEFDVITIPRYTGLGDYVADIIHRITGITPCPACTRRRVWLNKRFPNKRVNPVCRKLMLRILHETRTKAMFPFVIGHYTGRIYEYDQFRRIQLQRADVQ